MGSDKSVLMDTNMKEKESNPQIFDVEDLDVDIFQFEDSNVVSIVTPYREVGGKASPSSTPKRLTTIINKKWSLVLTSIPFKDMVIKYIDKTPKPRKIKTTTKLTVDGKMGKWMVEIASYKSKDEGKELDEEDFQITRVDLGTMDRDANNHHFKYSAQKILTHSEKDGKEKKELKKNIRILAQFIDTLGCFGPLSLLQAPKNFDPTSSENKKLLSKVQHGKSMVNAIENQIEGVIKSRERYIQGSRKPCDDAQTLICEIEKQNLQWEKEEHIWETLLTKFTEQKNMGLENS